MNPYDPRHPRNQITHQVGAQLRAVRGEAAADKFRDGVVLESERTGDRYVMSHVKQFSATLTRETPKVRGKSARRAEKKARRLARPARR